MKFFIYCLIVCLPLTADAQWIQISQGLYPAGTMSVGGETNIFLSASEATGSTNPNIAYSHSAGEPSNSWHYFKTEYEYEFFYEMDFVNDSVGFLSGGGWFSPHRDLLLRTTNAGVSWETMTRDTLGSGYIFDDLEFISSDSGFVSSGYGSELVRTTNGGSSWSSITIDTGFNYIADIHFVNSNLGFVTVRSNSNLGTQSKIYRTTDFGDTWKKVFEHSNFYNLADIYFINESVGYVIGENGSFLKTTDGGTTWTVQFLWPYNSLNAMWFVNEKEGFLNLGGIIQKTIDGGLSWNAQMMSTPNIVSKIQFTPSGRIGYLLAGGLLYKTINGGGATTSIKSVSLKDKFKIYPNPTTNQINLYCEIDLQIKAIWLTDISGRILKTFKAGEQILDVSDLLPGFYFLNIQSNEGNVSEIIAII